VNLVATLTNLETLRVQNHDHADINLILQKCTKLRGLACRFPGNHAIGSPRLSKLTALTNLSPLSAWVPTNIPRLHLVDLSHDATLNSPEQFFARMTALRHLAICPASYNISLDALDLWISRLTTLHHLALDAIPRPTLPILPSNLKSLFCRTLYETQLNQPCPNLESIEAHHVQLNFSNHPNLKTVKLVHVLHAQFFKTMFENQRLPNLTHLEIELSRSFYGYGYYGGGYYFKMDWINMLPTILKTLGKPKTISISVDTETLSIDANEIKMLVRFPSLRSLSLPGFTFETDKSFKPLIKAPKLKYLNLQRTNCCPHIIKSLQASPQHKGLRIDFGKEPPLERFSLNPKDTVWT